MARKIMAMAIVQEQPVSMAVVNGMVNQEIRDMERRREIELRAERVCTDAMRANRDKLRAQLEKRRGESGRMERAKERVTNAWAMVAGTAMVYVKAVLDEGEKRGLWVWEA